MRSLSLQRASAHRMATREREKDNDNDNDHHYHCKGLRCTKWQAWRGEKIMIIIIMITLFQCDHYHYKGLRRTEWQPGRGKRSGGRPSRRRRDDIVQKEGTCLFVGCLTSQQQARVSQGRICLDNFTCCHTEIEVADPMFYLTQSQYTDTRPTSPSADPITPGAWQGSHWSANFEVTGMTRPRKNPGASGIRTRDLPLSRWTP